MPTTILTKIKNKNPLELPPELYAIIDKEHSQRIRKVGLPIENVYDDSFDNINLGKSLTLYKNRPLLSNGQVLLTINSNSINHQQLCLPSCVLHDFAKSEILEDELSVSDELKLNIIESSMLLDYMEVMDERVFLSNMECLYGWVFEYYGKICTTQSFKYSDII
mgnify:CR=1 FL=1